MPKPRAPRVKRVPNTRDCYGCGWEAVPILDLKHCRHCGSDLCPHCDPGAGAICANCPREDDDER